MSRRSRKIIFMLHLKKNPTLKDFQEYVKKLEIERGFSKESILQKCLQKKKVGLTRILTKSKTRAN